MARLSAAAVLALALAAASVAAQNQPTFRSGANYVRVDMYASRNGQPVEDLQAADIELLEDGVPQTIDAFEYVKVRTLTPEDSRAEPNTIDNSRRMAGDPRARVFVIFLDTYHTQIEGSAKMRQPLINFLDRVLGPDDMVAMMTPEMAASEITFARKTTAFSNILQREWMWGRRGRLVNDDDRDDLYAACYLQDGIAAEMKARRREKLTLDALEDLMVHLAGVREERKAVVTVSEGWRLYKPNPELARSIPGLELSPGDVLGRPPRPTPADTARVQGSPKVQCESDRMALALIDHEQRLRELTQEANRGNVTFYPVYARGLTAFDSSIEEQVPLAQDATNLRARQNSLRFLADDTDGTSIINTNNIDGALRRIVSDLSSYYLMGYYATNTKLDGRFRSITVRVKRPGVTVRARKGYRGLSATEVSRGNTAAPSAAAPAAAPAGGTPSAATAVIAALTPVVSVSARAQFRIRASAWARPSAGGATEGSLWIVGELDPQTRKLPAWTPGAQADVAVLAPDGQQVVARRIDMKPGESAFTVQLPDTGGVAAGDYTVRVRLRSPVDGELGLSDTTHVVVKEAAALGEAIVWRRGPSTGTQYLRTADPRFQRSERIRLELATTSAEPATARVLDRTGTVMPIPAAVSARADASTQFRWVVVDVTLAPFAPADYAVEVTQAGSSQMTAFRVVP